ncbi:hypothetical protein [Escherichia coli]|jgi:hypothetical protein|uniref:Uncharacterized protein n=1 Tax=Escherichia coli TaxID=562 RepID=A0A0K4B0X6_ECOLX|nr:hypothetical protein [Escherichia coli]EFF0478234.1 hypothetical protein [Escherichia coli]EFK5850860.1 hypothetical protein [Escherichia coli]MBE8077863.1 hypothetical protein [Escherichia coli]MBE8081020.1 hypothetical protein [Escherichia coli]MBE8153914.1 hypothetical protein [Escherichia coli]
MALISVRNRFESFMEQRYPDLSLQVKGNIGASMKAQLGIGLNENCTVKMLLTVIQQFS